MNIRKQTRIVIRRNGRYLVGTNMMTGGLNWSWSIYDAWGTRDMEKARMISRITGGIPVLFNPVVNQTKVI